MANKPGKKPLGYRLQIKLVQIFPPAIGTHGKSTKYSVWCGKKIDINNFHSELNAMIPRFIEKISKEVTVE